MGHSLTQPDPSGPLLAFAGEGLIELTLEGERVTLDYGGDAANAATMCARLGGAARLLGRVGSDPLGHRLLSFWRARGVDTSAIVIDREAPTGIYLNEPSDAPGQARRSFTYWRRGSAGSRWSPADVADPAVLTGVAGLVVTGITISVSESCALATWSLVERARAHSVPIACILNYRAGLDPDRDALAQLVAAADVVIASVEDLEQAFPDHSSVEPPQIASRASGELVVTDGGNGASVTWTHGTVRQPALSVKVRDTVGAGDALAGAYLWARLCARQPPVEALAWGVAASSVSVEREGCASSYPDAAAATATRTRLPAAEHRLSGAL
jgi:2-dehydro-3-deoxygluconokinase